MTTLYNLARMTTETTGTGTMTLLAAVPSFLTFAEAGAQDEDIVTYAIEDGIEREIGRGIYHASGPTLTRNVLRSTNSNYPILLSGNAQVAITPAAEDFEEMGGGGGIEAGTVMLFYQASAPVGWTKLIEHNDKALRVTSGIGGVAGGNNPFSAVMAQTVVGNHTLSLAQIPGGIASSSAQLITVYPGGNTGIHVPTSAYWYQYPSDDGARLYAAYSNSAAVGSINYMSAYNTITVSSTNTGGGAHNHPITMNIQYLDLILAEKD